MDFTFEGFQPGLPYGVYVLLLLVAVALAWWSYREYKSIRPAARYGLIGLRSTVFFILLLLLMNPLFQTTSVDNIPPAITVYLDNSQSVSIEKGGYEGSDSYREVLNRLDLQNRSEADLTYYAFGENLHSARPDTLELQSSETNLYAPVNHIKQNSSESDAAILITDGIYTAGQDPSYLSTTLKTPVYVIGLGDTVDVNDLIVKNVVTSNTGYTRTEHPVETTIINNGFSDENIRVEIISGDQVIASKTYIPGNQKSARTLKFNIPLTEEGLEQYKVRIPEKEGEWTGANNEGAFSIDIRSNRDRVLHLSFEIHPDVKTVRRILNTDQNISLTSRTWIGQNQFIEGDLPSDTDTLDLVILQGYPNGRISSSVHQRIEQMAQEIPLLFIRTPQQNLSRLPSPLQNLLPITVNSPVNSLEANIYTSSDETSHPIMDLSEVSYDNLPLINAPVQNVGITPATTSLFKVSYQGTQTDVPFIAVKQLGNKRSGIINGFGVYRLRQHYDKASRSFITDLLHNLVTWTASDTDDQLLRVNPVQQVFDGNDPVRLNAFLRNESGEREPDASVDLTLNGKSIQEKQYTMENEGNGQYSLNLGTWPEGVYNFQAVAKKESRTIDSHEGEFSIAPTQIELINTTRNAQLLNQIATQSDGKYYNFNQADSLWNDIRNAGLLEHNTIRQTSTYYPYRHIFWFITVILLLGAEWLLRKYYALP